MTWLTNHTRVLKSFKSIISKHHLLLFIKNVPKVLLELQTSFLTERIGKKSGGKNKTITGSVRCQQQLEVELQAAAPFTALYNITAAAAKLR